MLLKELINKSVYGTIGYISSESDIEALESYLLYNLPTLKKFKQIIVATNYSSLEQLPYINKNLWETYFPGCILLDSKVNRGHNHGYTDLDNMLVDYCKENNIEWLCKGANDIIIQNTILDKEIGDADFYYLNGIGYGGMANYNFDYEKIIAEDFYPQTNFYFINTSKIDYLNNKEYLDETYNKISNIPDYNGKIWEYIPYWSCEDFLKQCIQRNNLIKEHLIPQDKYRILLNTVKGYNIHDCSHKNIMIEGICHFPNTDEPIIEI
jgi:hypothetical protein